MSYLLLCLTVVLACCNLASVAESQASRRTVIYVSPAGNDQWSGLREKPDAQRQDGPVATLERARDIVRGLKQQEGGVPRGGVIVELAGGTYELARPFELAAEDSGTLSRPVTYRAAKGQQVHLIGGKLLSGFQPVTDAAILKRLDPAAHGHVLQADLKAHGITEFPEMKSAGTWGNSDPGLELFFADEPMMLARWPNEGYARMAAVLGPTPVDVRGTKGTAEGIFTYEGDRPSRWAEEPDLMANGFWMWDWADQRYRVKSIDTATRTVTLDDEKNKHAFGFRKGQWFYICLLYTSDAADE